MRTGYRYYGLFQVKFHTLFGTHLLSFVLRLGGVHILEVTNVLLLQLGAHDSPVA